jgi:hypothetical protein
MHAFTNQNSSALSSETKCNTPAALKLIEIRRCLHEFFACDRYFASHSERQRFLAREQRAVQQQLTRVSYDVRKPARAFGDQPSRRTSMLAHLIDSDRAAPVQPR